MAYGGTVRAVLSAGEIYEHIDWKTDAYAMRHDERVNYWGLVLEFGVDSYLGLLTYKLIVRSAPIFFLLFPYL